MHRLLLVIHIDVWQRLILFLCVGTGHLLLIVGILMQLGQLELAFRFVFEDFLLSFVAGTRQFVSQVHQVLGNSDFLVQNGLLSNHCLFREELLYFLLH